MAGLKEQVLTMEQMNHLRKIGVDTTQSSVVLIFKDDEGEDVPWEDVTFVDDTPYFVDYDGQKSELYPEYLDAENGDYDHSFRDDCGVFMLTDIWNVLPKEIINKDSLYRYYLDEHCSKDDNDFEISYITNDDTRCINAYFDMDFKNAAYKMLCWVAENNYLMKS